MNKITTLIRHLVPDSIKNYAKKYSIPGKLRSKIIEILPKLTCIDIGASYYPHVKWDIFLSSPRTQWVAIDPNAKNLHYLNNWIWPAKLKIFENGLSEDGGEKILYIANIDSGSSILKPNIPPSMQHRFSKRLNDYYYPICEQKINTITLKSVVENIGISKLPIFIKIDTEGSELSILKGAESYFSNNQILGVELEATLLADPIMEDSGKFWQCCEYLESKGFELIALKPIMARSDFTEHESAVGNRYLLECDAVFSIKRDKLQARSLEDRLANFGFLFSYQMYEEMLTVIRDDEDLRVRILSSGQSVEGISSLLDKLIRGRRWL